MSDNQHEVYVVSVEVTALRGSAMWGEAAGAFVYCYTTAADAQQAIERATEALNDDSYEVAVVEWAVPSSEVAWDDEDASEAAEHSREAASSNGVVYSSFHAYESEHEH